jgi:myo-inositol-hexaphosphate 3-phosphohydrolase
MSSIYTPIFPNPMKTSLNTLLVVLCSLCVYFADSYLHSARASAAGAQQAGAITATQGDRVTTDALVWVNPSDPIQSLLLKASEKGLLLYRLTGTPLRQATTDAINALALRPNFRRDGQLTTLVFASRQQTKQVDLYQLDATTLTLQPLSTATVQVAQPPSTICTYQSPLTGKTYLFVALNSSAIEQWEIAVNAQQQVVAQAVQRFSTPGVMTSCVADDEFAHVYFAAEEQGIWKYSAEPQHATEPQQILAAGANNALGTGVAKVRVAYAAHGAGYLVAANRAESSFALYQRLGNNSYVTTLDLAGQVTGSQPAGEDWQAQIKAKGAPYVDGLLLRLNGAPQGMGTHQMISWSKVTAATNLPLASDVSWTFVPRPITTTTTAASGAGQPRGYLTTPQELVAIQQKAEQGLEPYHSTVAAILDWADKSWDFKFKTKENCSSADKPLWNDNTGGTPILYAKALAYHLRGDETYAAEVKDILEQIMTEVEQISVSVARCRLTFSWGTPELVAAADLIEGYWNKLECTGPLQTQYKDKRIGRGNCKTLFQNWLVKNPYYVVSYAAIHSQNNWGAAATNTTAYIADYVHDRPDLWLVHRNPNSVQNGKSIEMLPPEAYAYANQLMRERMNGYALDLGITPSCDNLMLHQAPNWPPVKSQITEKGIVPEEARREEYCNIPQYNGAYQNYPQLHLGHNIQQCELMLRRGDASCYDNIDNRDLPDYTFIDSLGFHHTTHLYAGRGSIERAIHAVIVESKTEWRHDSALAVAYRYYVQKHQFSGIEQWRSQLNRIDDCAQDLCFGLLTHGFAPDEQPQLPPVTAPVKARN